MSDEQENDNMVCEKKDQIACSPFWIGIKRLLGECLLILS